MSRIEGPPPLHPSGYPDIPLMIKEAQMATDQEMADDIRAKVRALRDAIVVAREAGLKVDIPLLVGQWLDSGHAPGEPAMWEIKRRTL